MCAGRKGSTTLLSKSRRRSWGTTNNTYYAIMISIDQ
jgi:hypothetical protein